MMNMPFQKLLIWQKSVELVNLVYDLTDTFPKNEVFGLSSQIRRSAVSVPSNIAEGSQRTSLKDFGHFILIAKGSLAELYTQLIIARNRKYLTEAAYKDAAVKIEEIDKMVRSFFLKISKKPE